MLELDIDKGPEIQTKERGLLKQWEIETTVVLLSFPRKEK